MEPKELQLQEDKNYRLGAAKKQFEMLWTPNSLPKLEGR
jgi:hypothetical protein